ncbi:hypothetical protein JCGZ_11234 [Jatropha curcas]|uniref:Uncharacterized protein n=1 Tax=Jatropha curcas TaxID=180498 RepID=A0A067KDQ0_JATCU|nr:hypothetical protein JCGZ_11234 [Jatropha curcas]
MEMILHDCSTERYQIGPPFSDYLLPFLENAPSNPTGNFVLVPDGLHCPTCFSVHGYPSQELSHKESKDFLLLLEHCPCFCAYIGLPRYWIMDYNDFLNSYFSRLDRKFDSLESLTVRTRNLEEKTWKLVREKETIKEKFSVGVVFEKLGELPEGILDDYKFFFPRILDFLYENRVGFVKGKYLVVSPELLLRICEGDISLFLKYLSEAYSLVQSKYCSVSRMAIEGGFWQLCPEFGGFFWKNIDLRNNFGFLKEFLKEKMILVKNFSLSMGPYYLIGGGYFSYIYNTNGDLVVWYIPNFWDRHNFGYSFQDKTIYHNSKHFWYGIEESEFGCCYNGITEEICDSNMLQYLRDTDSYNGITKELCDYDMLQFL